MFKDMGPSTSASEPTRGHIPDENYHLFSRSHQLPIFQYLEVEIQETPSHSIIEFCLY